MAASPRDSVKRIRVLFVCIGNSCRSPMAEALARHTAADVIDAASAGISPLGRVADLTRQVLAERGINASDLASKGMRQSAFIMPDLVINMTGIPGKSLFHDRYVEDWDVEDPFGEDLATYRRICEDIESRVDELAARLRAAAAGRKKGR